LKGKIMKANQFKKGQHVRVIKGDGIYTLSRDVSFTGIVVGEYQPIGLVFRGCLLEIMRDDGIQGSGPNGEWRCVTEHDGVPFIELLDDQEEADLLASYASFEGETPKSAHMAGLDKEEIDPAAYREFMRGLG
jgi:hypothetical protein